ncbi:MAG: hypothetical protein ACOY0T_35565 [Myxococcota bacterium]
MTDSAVSRAEARLLGVQLRLRDAKTLKRVINVLKKHNGTITVAAQELGVSARAFHGWIDDVPELAEHTRGRVGRPPVKKSTQKARAKR